MSWLRFSSWLILGQEAPAIPSRFIGVVSKLLGVAQVHGFTIYAVGGFVRDLLLGREPKDIDIVVEGDQGGIRFAQTAAKDLGLHEPVVYPRFGTAMLIIDGEQIEFVMPRKEYYSETFKPDKVELGSLEQDALRRDFGMNALYLRLSDMQLLDPTGHGFKDLEERKIKFSDPSAGDIIFTQDATRMLRAIRQSMQLGFQIDPEVVEAVRRNVHKLGEIPAERIRDELKNILKQTQPSQGLHFLQETGLLHYALPELEPMIRTDQPGPYHDKDVWEHTLKVLDTIPDDVVLRLAALLHDIGKPTTKTITEGIAHFFGHEAISAEMAEAILRRLKFPNEIIAKVVPLVEGHMRPHSYRPEWTDAAVRRFVRDLGDRLEQALQLAEADITGQRRSPAAHERIQQLRERIQKVQEPGEVSALPELLSGDELMNMFQRPPGPWIRRMKAFVSDQQMENPALTKEQAIELAKSHFQAHEDEIMAKAWIEV